jgi:hypothetical protein
MLLLTQFESILHPKLPIVVLVPWSKQARMQGRRPILDCLYSFYIKSWKTTRKARGLMLFAFNL